MNSLLRVGTGLLVGLSLLGPNVGRAQCPGAACVPGKASSPLASAFGMGIFKVTLGTLSNASAGYADGYKDYSCAAGLTGLSAPVSAPLALSVLNGTTPENVRVWVDYNNNGVFSTDELAFSSDNKTTHAGSLTPPATAALGVPLRVRVASDFANGTVPTACSTPEYSQTEDYALTLTANTSRPTAAFTPDATTTCSGTVRFTDRSTGGPTSWSWDFGDGSTSTQQNPTRTYAAASTYQVRLTATNANGSSTSAATAITYNPLVPAVAACPGLAATAYCCNHGLTRVRLGTLDNASADGSAGYQDFSCPQRTRLTVGLANTLNLTTGGTNPHDTRAWLDLNNDGAFTSNELLGEALAASSPVISFTVPAGGAGTVLNQPLRLRIVADGVGTNPRPCVAPTLGQVEDYTVTLVPNTSPPVVAFSSNYVAGACSSPANTYTFVDQSTNGPTSRLWSFSPSAGVAFVGGTSASSVSPQVQFGASGYYAVALTATNANGSATLSRPNYLLVQAPCLSYCAASGGYFSGPPASSFWITNLSVSAPPSGGAAFSSSSGNAAGGYAFSAQPGLSLVGGASQTISVTTNQAFTHRTSIWLDVNRDGVFANTTGAGGELLYNGLVSNTTLSSVTFTVPAGLGATRLRVSVSLNNNSPNPCGLNQGEAEVEDYAVNAGQPLAARAAQALLPSLSLSPNPTADGHLLLHLDDPAAAGRYALALDNVLGARVLSQAVPLSPNAPAALDLSALPPGLYLLRLTDARGQTAVRRVVRE